jgi:aryl-alcohol dehydrogenase-like predicted oxidoreductase
MNYRRLGKTGLKVGEISMGGLFVASFATAKEEARRAVHRALELGVNYIDTAPGYYNSEEVLGYALEGVSQPYILSTKLGGRPLPFNPQDKAALRASVEESLRLLKRKTIDILMIHEPDRPGQYDWYTDHDRFTGPVVDLLQELKAEGIIRFCGLGGTTAYELPRIIDTGVYDVVLTAFNYSLLWQEALWEVLPAAKRQGMGIVIGSPLQ